MQQDTANNRKVAPMMPIFKKPVMEAPPRKPTNQPPPNNLYAQSQKMSKAYEANKKPIQKQGKLY